MAKKLYVIREMGGIDFKGVHYPEHYQGNLTEWAQSDINAALGCGLIAELESEPEEIEEITNGKSKRS